MRLSDMIDGPVKMVTFDLYDTLVESDPQGWIRFQTALKLSGLDAELTDVMRAYTAGQRFFTVENGRLPIRDRTSADSEKFQIDLTRISLEALGSSTDDATVEEVKSNFRDDTKAGKILRYVAYDEVNDVLKRLRDQNIVTAVVSNADSDVTEFCLHMGFAEHMDIIVTSALVGWEKPDARTYLAALEPFGVPPEAALHVGDQPDSDVLGARQLGMAAALIDRYDQHVETESDAIRVSSLMKMVHLIEEHNRSVS